VSCPICLQERLSTFWGTVPTGHTATLNFTGTPARVFRIWLPYADPGEEVVFVINYFQVRREEQALVEALGAQAQVAQVAGPFLAQMLRPGGPAMRAGQPPLCVDRG
jgi:hypothetical protein